MATHVLEHDGCRLAFRVEGSGPPLVLIQGVGVQGAAWAPQVDALAPHFTCLTFDNRGMGASQPQAGALSVERMAADTAWLLEHLGWPSAHVAGHSLGGVIALQLALSQPGRVRSLALLCTVARGAEATALSRRMLWLGLRAAASAPAACAARPSCAS
jgi:pimeloyl-ACP methyl ester carboxylesterase